MHERIIILDFGSQYTQLIARRVREAGVYSEIHPCTKPAEEIRAMNPQGIILSGGPCSVFDAGAPQLDAALLEMMRSDGSPTPVLGICYGLQAWPACREGGCSGRAPRIRTRSPAYRRCRGTLPGHTRRLHRLDEPRRPPYPPAAEVSGYRPYRQCAYCGGSVRPVSPLRCTVSSRSGAYCRRAPAHRKLCNGYLRVPGRLDTGLLRGREEAEIRETVGDAHLILGLSGGVDSSVAAVLLHEAIGDKLTCIYVNNGVLRKGEWEEVQAVFRDHFHLRLKAVDATDLFLDRLAGVSDPEKKRKIIGNAFVEVFDHAAHEIAEEVGDRPAFLAQGTLYPTSSRVFRSRGRRPRSKHTTMWGACPKNSTSK